MSHLTVQIRYQVHLTLDDLLLALLHDASESGSIPEDREEALSIIKQIYQCHGTDLGELEDMEEMWIDIAEMNDLPTLEDFRLMCETWFPEVHNK